MKYQILDKNYELFKDERGLPFKLFRIIAMKDFDVEIKGKKITIKEGTIGGFVQTEKNLSQLDSSWIMHEGKVFGNATLNNSLVRDKARCFENCEIDNSIISGTAKVKGSAKIKGSTICENSDVFDQSVVINSDLDNGAQVVGNSHVLNCTLVGASRVSDSKVQYTTMNDQSEVCKGSDVDNCILKGRAVVAHKTIKNQLIEEYHELKETIGVD